MDWDAATAAVRRAQLGTFGTPIGFTPPGGSETTTTPGGAPLLGVFRSGSREISPLTLEVIVEKPNVMVDLADLAERPVEDSRFTIKGRTWRVKEDPMLDGEGGAVLELELVT